jgi:hypothetical protein
MEADEAKQVLTRLLPGDWRITEKGKTSKVLLDYQINGFFTLQKMWNKKLRGKKEMTRELF